MKKKLLPPLVACVLPLGLAHAEQLAVDAYALGGWTIAGPQPAPAAGAASLVLPAGGRVSRLFAGTEVSVRLATRPVFGPAAEDWPILELGAAALGFVRSGDAGRMVLLVDGREPVLLPDVFLLDADGLSQDAIAVTLARSAKVFSITSAGGTRQFPSDADSAATEVALSAGAAQPWAIEGVVVTTPDATAAAPRAADGPDEISPASVAQTHQTLAKPTGSSAATSGTAAIGAAAAVAAAPKAPVSATAGSLEVFTPPSVRPGRARAGATPHDPSQR